MTWACCTASENLLLGHAEEADQVLDVEPLGHFDVVLEILQEGALEAGPGQPGTPPGLAVAGDAATLETVSPLRALHGGGLIRRELPEAERRAALIGGDGDAFCIRHLAREHELQVHGEGELGRRRLPGRLERTAQGGGAGQRGGRGAFEEAASGQSGHIDSNGVRVVLQICTFGFTLASQTHSD